jgi:hypothetical protein
VKKNAHTLQVWKGGCHSVEPLFFRPFHCYIRSYCQNSDFSSILYPYRHSHAGFTDLASKALIQCGKSCKIGHTKPVSGRPKYSSANTTIPILSVQYRLASCSQLNSSGMFSWLLFQLFIGIRQLISVVGPPALLVLSKEYHLQMKSCNPNITQHDKITANPIKSRT